MSLSPSVLFITIPAYKESNITSTLQSLYNCHRIAKKVVVAVLINAKKSDGEDVISTNIQSYQNCLKWIDNHPDDTIEFRVEMNNNLNEKHGGVGLARKILMDQAAIEIIEIYKGRGLIAALDADCSVKENYLQSIFNHFTLHTNSPACSVYFEHPLTGDNYSDEVFNAIIQYELHLRYYKNALKYADYPSYFYTVGSSMVVTANGYLKQGGMNKRKAGEDFYFLQKMMTLGNFTELLQTTVYPSPRPSNRVPFGTGKAIRSILTDAKDLLTYDFRSFEALKMFFNLKEVIYKDYQKQTEKDYSELPQVLKDFLTVNDFDLKVREFRSNSNNFEGFVKRMYNWFNPFMVLKFLHYARDNGYPNRPLENQSILLLNKIKSQSDSNSLNQIGLLQLFREIDKK